MAEQHSGQEPRSYNPRMDEEHRTLDVYLVDGRPVDLRLDGESLYPVWFKLEFKETGDVSAKVKGVRLGTRFGDVINIHQGAP